MLKTDAIILKKQNIGETDRILTILTPSIGKKRVIVRAVRKPLSKLAGHLDTMMFSQLILTDDENLPKVTSAILVDSFSSIRENLPLLNRAYSITKLVERVVLEDVDEQPIFQLTIESLRNLDQGNRWEQIWLNFLSKLTHRLGLEPTSFTCNVCQKHLAEGGVWQNSQQHFICRDCPADENSVKLSINSLKLLKFLNTAAYTRTSRVIIDDLVAKQVEEVYLRLITEWLNKPWHTFSSLRR